MLLALLCTISLRVPSYVLPGTDALRAGRPHTHIGHSLAPPARTMEGKCLALNPSRLGTQPTSSATMKTHNTTTLWLAAFFPDALKPTVIGGAAQ